MILSRYSNINVKPREFLKIDIMEPIFTHLFFIGDTRLACNKCFDIVLPNDERFFF